MTTYSAKGGSDFAKVPQGTHIAVCTLVADVGLQPGSGAFSDPKVKLFLRFEVPSERITYEKDGAEVEGPMAIYHNFNASMNPKSNMRKQIESWRGAKFTDQEAELFDVRKLLGQTCMLQVVHTPDGKYANVSNIMAPPKGTAKLKPENPAVYFGPDDDSAYADLPKFLQNKWDEQLGADALQKPAPPLNQPSLARQDTQRRQAATSGPRTSDAEADAIAGAQSSGGGDFDDFIPFAARGKRNHWE